MCLTEREDSGVHALNHRALKRLVPWRISVSLSEFQFFFFLFGFLGCRRGPERTRARAHLSYGEAPGVRSGKR